MKITNNFGRIGSLYNANLEILNKLTEVENVEL